MFTRRAKVEYRLDPLLLQPGKMLGTRLTAGAELGVHLEEVSNRWKRLRGRWGTCLCGDARGTKQGSDYDPRGEDGNHPPTIDAAHLVLHWQMPAVVHGHRPAPHLAARDITGESLHRYCENLIEPATRLNTCS